LDAWLLHKVALDFREGGVLYTGFSHQIVLRQTKFIAVFFDILTDCCHSFKTLISSKHRLCFQDYDIKKFQFRKEKPTFGLYKVRADIFDRFFGSLPFRSDSRQLVGQARRGGRKGGMGGIPPAEPREFRSDIFK
jgi:hypothetical protein